MNDRQLADEMVRAARAATDAALAAGHDRHDKVTKDSAKRAAEEVYLRERGGHVPAEPRIIDQPRRGEADDAWQGRADLD